MVHSVYLVYNYKITNSKDWEKEIYSITYISLWVCVKMLTKLRYYKSSHIGYVIEHQQNNNRKTHAEANIDNACLKYNSKNINTYMLNLKVQ